MLVGENGAGKSTLMKILAGVEQPTSGRRADGRPSGGAAQRHGAARPGSASSSRSSTSAQPVGAGQPLPGPGDGPRRSHRSPRRARKARELLARLEQDIDPDEIVSDLRIGQQQIVEIAKALTHDVRVLIMDEPTSALSQAEVHGLFRVIRDLKSRGVSIVYISHKLEELLQIGDRITVLRDGRVVATAAARSARRALDHRADGGPLAGLAVHAHRAPGRGDAAARGGRDAAAARRRLPPATTSPSSCGPARSSGSTGSWAPAARSSWRCSPASGPRRGRGLARRAPPRRRSVADRIDAGIVLVPEDRKTDGLVPTLSVAHNMVLASLHRYLAHFCSRGGKASAAPSGMMRDLPFASPAPAQHRLAVRRQPAEGRGRQGAPDEPQGAAPRRADPRHRRGRQVGDLPDHEPPGGQGYGILFVSSELKEVMAMADRIVVLSKGARDRRVRGRSRDREGARGRLGGGSSAGPRGADQRAVSQPPRPR